MLSSRRKSVNPNSYSEMADQIQWINGHANVPGSVEKIFPGTHIRQHQWQDGWNAEFITPNNDNCYSYISDYECTFNHPVYDEDVAGELWQNLQAAKQVGLNLPITDLTHFTTDENADAIVESGGFRGGMKKFNEDGEGNVVSARLSWWSPVFFGEDIYQVRSTLGDAIQPFISKYDCLENLKSQFATSDAFIPQRQARLYGSSYFQFGINKLCRHYAENYVGGGKLQYKILGTFAYKKEVMHAVLICSQANGAGQFAAYPPVPEEDINNEAVVTRDANGNWVWKPQTTGTEIGRLEANWQKYPRFRRWEHVAFAFHIPDELGHQINVPDLDEHLHFIQL